MEAAEHGIPSSYSCLSQGTVHILICSSSSRITVIGPFPVQRGVRQGMSIVGTAVQSVHQRHSRWCLYPSQSLDYRKTPTPSEDSCTQTIVQCLLTLKQSLLAASTAIEQWANRWEMQFGVAKCGHHQLHWPSSTHDLTNPLEIRLPWTVVVMGKAYYGLELVGGNKSHLAPLQTTINKGIRLFTGARLSTAIRTPFWLKTGMGLFSARSLVLTSTLVGAGSWYDPQRWFWSRRTKQLYRNRYWLTPQVRPKKSSTTLFALMETLRTCGDSASLQKYVTRQFLDTFGFSRIPVSINHEHMAQDI
ncbi:hypothetical protein BASA83_012091 [Batrachochytrium salamandrivorans]|nr:hypothetical protein BASA83_012091 [Batrachochytrium salamandrivorans]